ncbi:hypothetical protein Tsubulata_004586 [Turnera subulata]|uniref:Uncharacterized protein n=1 Tax=Turnera subulata TaxID=218843 RepID=A0A9Q0GEV1_9ROSI|nr:hypothetical protein Tsubulata_004586 [Turnera subulata]
MWLSFWRSFDRFSLHHFKYVINELREIEVVDSHNWELVVDLVQSIAEIVTYGDKQDSKIFEVCSHTKDQHGFKNCGTIASVSEYNDSKHGYRTFGFNNYVNSIVAHQYNFDAGDLSQYYVAFLRETCNNQRSKEILSDTDKIDDDLYYLKDILCVGESRLSKVVMQNGLNLSPITALYMVSRVLQVLNDKNICNFLAGIILYPCMYTSESNPDQAGSSNFLQNHLNVVESLLCTEVPESFDESSLLRNSPNYILSHLHSANCPMDQNVCPERS